MDRCGWIGARSDRQVCDNNVKPSYLGAEGRPALGSRQVDNLLSTGRDPGADLRVNKGGRGRRWRIKIKVS